MIVMPKAVFVKQIAIEPSFTQDLAKNRRAGLKGDLSNE